MNGPKVALLYNILLEKLDRDKHSSLVGKLISIEENKVL
jgi:hypothetical protein